VNEDPIRLEGDPVHDPWKSPGEEVGGPYPESAPEPARGNRLLTDRRALEQEFAPTVPHLDPPAKDHPEAGVEDGSREERGESRRIAPTQEAAERGLPDHVHAVMTDTNLNADDR
jgi:hypothetical protein